MSTAAEPSPAPRYAAFWERLVAFTFVDAPIAWLLYYIAAWAAGYGLWYGMAWGGIQYGTMYRAQQVFYFGVTVVVDWLYYAVLESSSLQATVGKRLFGLVVTDEEGQRISFGRASGRYFAKFLSALPLGLGFLRVIWSHKKQAFHDRLVCTVVSKRHMMGGARVTDANRGVTVF